MIILRQNQCALPYARALPLSALVCLLFDSMYLNFFYDFFREKKSMARIGINFRENKICLSFLFRAQIIKARYDFG